MIEGDLFGISNKGLLDLFINNIFTNRNTSMNLNYMNKKIIIKYDLLDSGPNVVKNRKSKLVIKFRELYHFKRIALQFV